jgi:hypothetical protein
LNDVYGQKGGVMEDIKGNALKAEELIEKIR